MEKHNSLKQQVIEAIKLKEQKRAELKEADRAEAREIRQLKKALKALNGTATEAPQS